MNDAELLQISKRLQATRIELDEALITRMLHEPWRIAEEVYGHASWPPPIADLSDALLTAEQHHRWLLRLYGWQQHPRVHRASLCVDAILRMVAE